MILKRKAAEGFLGKALPGKASDWYLLSSDGSKNLGGPYQYKADAINRERQVQFFKRNPYKSESVPEKYLAGLSKQQKIKRVAEIVSRSKTSHKDPYAYKPFSTDKGAITIPSNYTMMYHNVYGKDAGGSPAKVAKATGIPVSILREVYNRGMAAWRTGHRPGASQHAWGIARMYSFVFKGKTWRTADADLAKKLKSLGYKVPKQFSKRNKRVSRNPEEVTYETSMGDSPDDALIGALDINSNPAFFDKPHNFKEILISKSNKKISRGEIISYYLDIKNKIFPHLKDKTVMVIIATGKNKFIRKRLFDKDSYIYIDKLYGIDDPNSFEYWIYRRVIEFHPVITSKMVDRIFLDIDMHNAEGYENKNILKNKIIKALPRIKKIMRSFNLDGNIKTYESGQSNGIHLEARLSSKRNVDKLRKDFTKKLSEEFASDPYFTTSIARGNRVRLDTTSLHQMGSLRSPYSLSIIGESKKPL